MLKKYLILLLSLSIVNTFAHAKIEFFQDKQAPEGTVFLDSNLSKTSLENFGDKVVLLTFWANWCANCTKELLELDCLQKDFRKLPFVVVAIAQSNNYETIKNFFKSYRLENIKPYYDAKAELFKAFEVVGLPSSYLIDKRGHIVAQFKGNVNWHTNESRDIILSYLEDDNDELPKNSYKDISLNQVIKKSEEQIPITVVPPQNNQIIK